jgi:HemY protein
MKSLVTLFLILLIAIWLGLEMHSDPGYVLIAYKSWTIETTLWATLLALFLLFITLSFLISLFRKANTVSERVYSWSLEKHLRKARRQTNLGLCEWAEGKWAEAEKRLLKAAKYSEIPLLNYLIAARAAQSQGEYDKRDTYLRMAHASTPGVEVAVALTQAQLQLSAGQLERALATLTHLSRLVPKHTYVMRLLQQVYEELHDWKSLQDLLPALHKYKVLQPEKLQNLERKLYLQLLIQGIKERNFEYLSDTWSKISSELRKDPELLLAYSDALIKNKKSIEAEKLLRNTLKKSWDSKLAEKYSMIPDIDPIKQLATVESWLKIHDNDPTLLFCLGKLCKQRQLWGKAQHYLETSKTLKSTPEVFYELGQVMEALGNKDAALDYYSKQLVSEQHS